MHIGALAELAPFYEGFFSHSRRHLFQAIIDSQFHLDAERYTEFLHVQSIWMGSDLMIMAGNRPFKAKQERAYEMFHSCSQNTDQQH